MQSLEAASIWRVTRDSDYQFLPNRVKLKSVYFPVSKKIELHIETFLGQNNYNNTINRGDDVSVQWIVQLRFKILVIILKFKKNKCKFNSILLDDIIPHHAGGIALFSVNKRALDEVWNTIEKILLSYGMKRK